MYGRAGDRERNERERYVEKEGEINEERVCGERKGDK